MEKGRLRGDLINVYKYVKGECQEDGARLFSVTHNDRTRSNWVQAGTLEVLLKYETKLFYGERDRTQEQAAQGGLWNLLLWRFSRLTWTCSCVT